MQQQGVLPVGGQSRVFGAGSIAGVDTQRFYPQPKLREQLRARHGLAAEVVVLMYLGRLHPDKGLHELAQAFAQLKPQQPQLHLMVVGPDEGNFSVVFERLAQQTQGAVTLLPYTAAPEHVLQMADILVLPSHRAGFGMVIVEAAALGIPAVASRIYGIADALDEGTTGLMFAAHDVADLARAVQTLSGNADLRQQMGLAAQARVRSLFDQNDVVKRFVDYHHTCLQNNQR